MTYIEDRVFSCAVCGEKSKHPDLLSTIEYGSRDLDLRPAMLRRSTIPTWVQECPNCGYVNSTIDTKPPLRVNRKWLERQEYRTCDGIPFQNDLSQRFYREYLVCKAAGKRMAALSAICCAAWMCDDHQEKENAKTCRLIAAEIAKRRLFPWRTDLIICWCDLLRRGEQFERLLKKTRLLHTISKKGSFAALLAFERKLAEQKDAERYTYQDAMAKADNIES